MAQINGASIFDYGWESSNQGAHVIKTSIPIDWALKGGNNSVWGKVYDRSGEYATLFFFVSGTYKAGFCY
jgi:hypothetical protein